MIFRNEFPLQLHNNFDLIAIKRKKNQDFIMNKIDQQSVVQRNKIKPLKFLNLINFNYKKKIMTLRRFKNPLNANLTKPLFLFIQI